MEKSSFNFSNLTEWEAVNQIVSQEKFEFNNTYKFNLYCKDGFRDVLLIIDEDGVWFYTSIILSPDKMILAGVTVHCEDGEIEYHEEILTRKEFNLFKAAADANPRYEDDGRFNGYVIYKDLLNN